MYNKRLAARIASILALCPVLVAGWAAEAWARPDPRHPSIAPGKLAPAETISPGVARAAGGPAGPAATFINWTIATRDNGASPYIIIDKGSAELFVFDPSGRLLAKAPVLIGVSKGDTSAPGIGDMPLARIPVSQRTTPAGRFEARFGNAVGYKDKVLWVDFENAVALHPLVTSNARERRLQRLQSQTSDDNRITFGCINVDPDLYKKVIEPLFRSSDGGIVYILPETRPMNEVFARFPAPSGRAAMTFAEAFEEFRLPTRPAQASGSSQPGKVRTLR